MKPSMLFSRLAHRADLGREGGAAAGALGGEEGISVSWKGWTNGGGERVSTAAQFSRLGTGATTGQAALAAAPAHGRIRTAATEAPAAPARAFPVDAEALFAPIGTAIERLVLTGRDQLSLTVRFGEGGSLSLRLVLRNGEIATQIQTDVPGLEGALRSSWNQLANEWHGRGLKLGQPQFVQGDVPDQRGQDLGRRRHGAGHEGADADPETPGWRSALPSLTRRPAVAAAAVAAGSVPALDRSGLETWA